MTLENRIEYIKDMSPDLNWEHNDQTSSLKIIYGFSIIVDNNCAIKLYSQSTLFLRMMTKSEAIHYIETFKTYQMLLTEFGFAWFSPSPNSLSFSKQLEFQKGYIKYLIPDKSYRRISGIYEDIDIEITLSEAKKMFKIEKLNENFQ